MSGKRKLLVVVGAGASRNLGVNNQGLPLMADWMKTLKGELNAVVACASQILGLDGQFEDAGFEFEKKLTDFLEWERSIPKIKKLADLGFPNGFPDGSQSNIAQWILQSESNARNLKEVILKSLFDNFSQSKVGSVSARDAYGAMLIQLGVQDGSGLSFATTNYDPAIEIGLGELGLRPYWGEDLEHGSVRTLHFDSILSASANRIPVLHLHGRVGWYRDSNRYVAYPPSQAFNPTMQPAILLPDTAKNYSEDEMTREIWHQFEELVSTVERVVVIGHALHDNELVKVLATFKTPQRMAVMTYMENFDDHQQLAKAANSIRTLLPDVEIMPVNFGPKSRFSEPQLKAWLSK